MEIAAKPTVCNQKDVPRVNDRAEVSLSIVPRGSSSRMIIVGGDRRSRRSMPLIALVHVIVVAFFV